ncbi:MAG: hypothetical protein PVJ42_06145 [bacterium]
MKRHMILNVFSLALTAAVLCGCAGRGPGRGETGGAGGLARIADGTGSVALVEGNGKAVVENRLGKIEIEFEMFYEPGRILQLMGELEPGFLPFDGEIEVTSTPDTTLAYVNGMPLVPDSESYPGRVVHPALISICLGGEWVLDWLEKQDCGVAEKVECGGIGFEFDLDGETGRVKSWTLRHEDPDGSYDGFLYRSRSEGRLQLPEILTGMAHPFEVAVYVEYYQISATIR